jgi:hypothetical protein
VPDLVPKFIQITDDGVGEMDFGLMKKLQLIALSIGLLILIPVLYLACIGYCTIAEKRPLEPVLQILSSQFPVPFETERVQEWNRDISIAEYRAAPFSLRNSFEWSKFILLQMEDNDVNRQKLSSWEFYEEVSNLYRSHINTAGFRFPEGGLAGTRGQMGPVEVGPNAPRYTIHPEAYEKARFLKWSQGRTRFKMTCCFYPPEICPGRRLSVFGHTTYPIPKEFKDTLLVSISLQLSGSGFTDAPKEIEHGLYWPLRENE